MHGPSLQRWLTDHDWTPTDGAASSSAYVDEAQILSLTLRRIWHTPLRLERPRPTPRTGTGIQVLLQIEGTTRVDLSDGTVHELRPGTALAVEAGRMRRLLCPGPAGRVELDVAFGAVPHVPITVPPCRMDDAVTWSALLAAVSATLDARPAPTTVATLHLQAGLVGFVSALVTEMSGRADLAAVTPDETLLDRALRAIQQRATDPDTTVASLARTLGVSRRHLARAFHDRGWTVSGRLTATRLRAARVLLREEPRLSHAQVAREAGFPSPAALRRALDAAHRRDDDTSGADAGPNVRDRGPADRGRTR